MARPSEYTPDQLREALALRAQGRSIRSIAAMLGLSKTTVHTIVLRWFNTGTEAPDGSQ